MAIRIGTSGFIYEHWRRRFYPPSGRGSELELYAQTFDTVELDVTFYRMPSSATFRSWAARVPDGFLFARQGQSLPHPRPPAQGAAAIRRAPGRASQRTRIPPRADPIQLPPDLEVDLGALEETLDAFPTGIRLAVEPRHSSWFVNDLRRRLSRTVNLGLCVADRRGPITPLWRTADWTLCALPRGPRDCRGHARAQ